MKIQIVTARHSGGVEVVGVYQGAKPELDSVIVKKFLSDQPKFGKTNEVQLLYLEEQTLLLVGLGQPEKVDYEVLQNWAGTAVKFALNKFPEINLTVPAVQTLSQSDLVEALCIGAQIAGMDIFSRYKSDPESERLKTVYLTLDRPTSEHSSGLSRGSTLAEGINLARRLGDLPPNEMTPTFFVNEAKKVAKGYKLKITLIDEKTAAKKGMGAFVAVASGSDQPSYLVVLEYLGNPRSKEIWGLVGKGVTFDTGGISIKDASKMDEMKYDMSGAGSVLGVMRVLGELKPRVNVVGVMALTENLPSGRSFRPGDILKTYSGKTVEVINTDAEGRLILIDAISLAQKDYRATKLVDLATLTGAMIVALGDDYTGVFGNDDAFANQLVGVGREVGERYWQLPMDENFDQMVKSKVADITNIGHGGSMPGAAGAITGAKFIQAGVEKGTPWVHLDIAGTAWDLKEKPYRFVGATGVGVKTLVRLLTNQN